MKTKLILLNLFILFSLSKYSSQEYINFYPWANSSTSFTTNSDPNPIQSDTKTGCVTANVNIAIADGAFQVSNPQWAYTNCGMSSSDGYGLKLGVNWINTNGNIQITIDLKQGGNYIDLPVSFKIFDINASACPTSAGTEFIDVVRVRGFKKSSNSTIDATTFYKPTMTNDAAASGNVLNTSNPNYNEITGGSGNGCTQSSLVTFNTGVSQIRITYKSGSGSPSNCGSWSLTNVSDPKSQEIYISALNLNLTCSVILPLELTYFNYQCTDQTQLVWETNSERNNDYFMVYESSDGVNFEPIRQIDGVGNSLTPTQYQTPVFGSRLQTMYYKLEQVDFDGTKTELATLSIPVNCQSSDELYVVGPNPFKNELTIEHHNQENSQLSIINAEGKLIYESTLEETKNQHFIPTDSWSKGVYVVHIQSKTKIENFRIIKD